MGKFELSEFISMNFNVYTLPDINALKVQTFKDCFKNKSKHQ